MPKEQFFYRVDFLLALCEALHKYGMPSHRIEFQVAWAAREKPPKFFSDALERFGIECVVGVFPTYISTMFKRPGAHATFIYL